MQYLLNQILKSPSKVFRSRNDIATRLNIDYNQVDEVVNYILSLGGEPTETEITLSEKRTVKEGEILSYDCPRPMSPDQLVEYAGVDRISTVIKRVWLKSHKNNVWTYSILIEYIIPNFYNKEELKERLAELLPSYKANRIPVRHASSSSPQRKIINISDLHAGSSNKGAPFAQPYERDTLGNRLLQIVNDVSQMRSQVDSLDIAILGDQMDGFNAETTRGGHKLDSLSNKDQFDIYVSAMKSFYTELFSLGLTDNISIINVENSNHSGNGLSYFANSVIAEWLKGNFPSVQFVSSHEAIFYRTYGNHAFAYTHGKDEKFMKRPMPLKLDDKTDLQLQSYFLHHGLNGKHCHLFKGDLHQYGVSEGKFGRYVNVGSIVGGNNYSDLNFGKSTPSALVEIIKPDRNWINSIKVDLK